MTDHWQHTYLMRSWQNSSQVRALWHRAFQLLCFLLGKLYHRCRELGVLSHMDAK